MAVFTFNNIGSNGGGASSNWNYSDREKDDFATQIDGTVVEMKQVQETQFGTNAPLFWGRGADGKPKKVTEDTGQPCLNFCIVIDTVQFGEKEWTFNPKSRKDTTIDPKTGRPKNPDGLSRASMAIHNALIQAGMDPSNLDQLGGMSISVSTKEPPEGFNYGQGNPRPFGMRINGKGDKPFRGCFPFGHQPTQQPVQQSQPAPSRMQQAMEQAGQAVRQANMHQQGSLPQQQNYQYDDSVPLDVYDEDMPF